MEDQDGQAAAKRRGRLGSYRALAGVLVAVGLIAFVSILWLEKQGHSRSVAETHPTPMRTGVPWLNTTGSLLNIGGVGIKQTQKFTTTGDWDVEWAYDCSNIRIHGQFAFGVADSDTRRGYADTSGVKQTGDKGNGVQHYRRSGSFFLIIDSRCIWHVAVKG